MRMRIRPGKMDPDTRVKTFFQDLLKLPYKAEMTILFSFLFSLISVLKLKPLRDREILLSPFLNSSDLGHENKTCFFFFSLPLGFRFVDPHILADPDPGSENLADSMDPGPQIFEHYQHESQNVKIRWLTFTLPKS